MEKFSQKAKSLVPDPYDFFTNGAIPRDETGLINRSLKFSITDGVMPRGGGIVLEHLQSPEMQSPEISENDKKELKNMKSQLIGEISTLVSRVANYDNVLEGSCDACPSRYFSIKGT